MKIIATEKMTKAAVQLFKLMAQLTYPVGKKDADGRWHPTTMLSCCKKICEPCRTHPDSLFRHQRTVKHVAIEFGVAQSDLRKEAVKLDGEVFKGESNLKPLA